MVPKHTGCGWLLGALIALLITLAGCQGGSASLETNSGDVAQSAGAPTGWAGLPALPVGTPEPREASYSNVIYYAGNGIFDTSANVIFTSDSVLLPAAPGALEYALYSFNTGGYNPNKLEVGLSVSPSTTAWVGVSDYFTNTWQFHGPYTGLASIDLDSPNYLSPFGQVFVVVVAYDGAAVTCNYLALTYDNAVVADYSIAGTVLDEHGAPIGGARLNATPGSIEVVTNGQGQYYLPLTAAGAYTISASSLSDFTFTPASIDVNVAGHETGADFTGSRVDVLGRITTAEGAGVAGVALTLNPGGKSATSGADGGFGFPNVAAGDYTVEPVLAGYTFEPQGRNITVAMNDLEDVDFTATGGQPTYVIRGQILEGGATPVAGVVLSLTPGNRSTQTDASGNYAFYTLGNGTYQVEPHLGFYTFAPGKRTVIVDNANESGVDFAATPPPPTYTVSGVLTDSDYGDGIPNAQVRVFLNSDLILTTYTNYLGAYSFTVPDGTYLVYPFKAYYNMASPFVTVNGADATLNITGNMPNGATWDSFASAFVSNNCIQCHRPDSISAVDPPLRNYNEAKTAGSASNFRVQNGSMPPDWTVPELYKKYFQEWKDNGYPLN